MSAMLSLSSKTVKLIGYINYCISGIQVTRFYSEFVTIWAYNFEAAYNKWSFQDIWPSPLMFDLQTDWHAYRLNHLHQDKRATGLPWLMKSTSEASSHKNPIHRSSVESYRCCSMVTVDAASNGIAESGSSRWPCNNAETSSLISSQTASRSSSVRFPAVSPRNKQNIYHNNTGGQIRQLNFKTSFLRTTLTNMMHRKSSWRLCSTWKLHKNNDSMKTYPACQQWWQESVVNKVRHSVLSITCDETFSHSS